MPALGSPGPTMWPVTDVPQLKAAIRRLTQLSLGDNLPKTVAVRAHVMRRAVDLNATHLLPGSWTPDGYVRKTGLDLAWLREDAWDLGRAAHLPEVAERARTYIDFDGSVVTARTVGEAASVKAGILPEGDYNYAITLLNAGSIDELGEWPAP